MKSRPGALSISRLRVRALTGALIAGWLAVAHGQGTMGNPPFGPHSGGQSSASIVSGGSAFQAMQVGDQTRFAGPTSPQGQGIASRRSGLQLEVVVGSATQFGYQPLSITATRPQAGGAARRLRVEFSVGGWGRDLQRMTVVELFTLGRGAASATTSLLVPQYEDWQLCSWQTWVDDELDEELCAQNVALVQQGASAGVCMLVVSESGSSRSLPGAFQALAGGTSPLRTLRPQELPVDWKRYSPVDLVVLSASEFAVLPARYPDQLAALRRWLRTGGNLWLTEAGASWSELPGVEAALGLARGAAGAPVAEVDDADNAILARGWRFAELGENALQPVEGALTLSGFAVDADTTASSTPSASGGSPQRPKFVVETSRPWFAVRGYGLGAVAAFRGRLDDGGGRGRSPAGAALDAILAGAQSAYGVPETTMDPALAAHAPVAAALTRSLLLPRLSWTGRHGNQPDEANLEFNNWLIPDVGVAPVGQFQFLISLFVLGIGPLNYWWLKRRKKLPMLIATVPAAAAAVTLLLLGVGLLGDGLGARVRARSLTLIDQTQGEAVTWSRLSYYAGLSPRGGLALPSDTVVYPIVSTWGERRYRRSAASRRTLQWTDQQELASGWLPARTPTQYLTISARPSRRRLELRNVADGLRVVNRLGVVVTHLAVQDHDGRIYWCENMAPDSAMVAQPAKHNDATARLRRLFADNQPQFPPGADAYGYARGFYGPQPSHNLMEAHLEAVNSPVIDRWANGSYIAVTDRGVDLALGLDAIEEEASFHLIQGRW